jgi:hypothetical protein
MSMHLRRAAILLLGLVAACGKSRQGGGGGGGGGAGGGAPRALIADATTFYDAYAQALREGKREQIASFYHPQGARIVLNGQSQHMTRAGLDSVYRASAWTVPTFFAFDSLKFDSLNARQVLVTGHFRMQRGAGADTLRAIYAALVQAVDSTFGIRFEHETPIPRK